MALSSLNRENTRGVAMERQAFCKEKGGMRLRSPVSILKFQNNHLVDIDFGNRVGNFAVLVVEGDFYPLGL